MSDHVNVSSTETACCTPTDLNAPIQRDEAEQLALLLKAVADPTRLQLVSFINGSEKSESCVCDLTESFELSQPTISHHLKVLHSVGLLDREKRGVWVYYAVRPEALTAVAGLFQTASLTPA